MPPFAAAVRDEHTERVTWRRPHPLTSTPRLNIPTLLSNLLMGVRPSRGSVVVNPLTVVQTRIRTKPKRSRSSAAAW